MQAQSQCPLLQSEHGDLVCLGGVNFFAVGENREICQECELRAMFNSEALPDCDLLDIYTYFSYETQQVQPIFKCDLCVGEPGNQQCASCPAMVALADQAELVAAD